MGIANRSTMIALLLGASIPLSGCASLDGQAESVLSAGDVDQVAKAYSPKVALEAFYAAGTDRRAYRDKVIGLYLASADIRYLDFRRNLSREVKGTNLVTDLALLGLTAGASLATQSTANALSAGAAGLAGSRASISKELWFEKTLPVLIAAMDARRTEIRTQILQRMQSSPEAYSLAEAFSDIARYQEAASLDSAIDVVSASTNARSVEADKQYAGMVLTYSGAPPAGSQELKTDIKRRLEAALAVTPAKINEVADALSVPHGATDKDTMLAILGKLNASTRSDELDTISDAVTAKLGGN